uniref:DUF1618 domain-containing protein n=1 Tax=Oryza punctata TaxID=4537 RepID=A0A1V1H0R5_ORYPU|nr:hypothetical protein [Oryza punctata]
MLFTLPVPITDEELPPTKGDLAMCKQPPPLTSFLCLPQRSLGEAAHCFIEIVCADSAGRLLLSAKPRPAPAATTSAPPPLPPRQAFIIICDATNLKIKRLPLPVGATCDDNERGFPCLAVALLADPRDEEDGDAYIVVLLHANASGAFQKVLFYESKTEVLDRETNDQDWSDTETHDQDWSEKLLSCSQQPPLRYVQLPEGCTMDDDDDMGAPAVVEKLRRRCIGVSDGKLRYLQIDSSGQWIAVWTLTLKDGTFWEHTVSVDLVSLRADQSFQEAGLNPHIFPSVAAIHPVDTSTIFLVQNSVIFSVNSDATTSSSKVGEHHKFLLNDNEITPSLFLFPWLVHDPAALLPQETPPRSNCSKRWLRALKLKQAFKRGIVWLSENHEVITYLGDIIDFLPIPSAGSLRSAAICVKKVGSYCSKTGKILKFHNSRFHANDPVEALSMEDFQIINDVAEDIEALSMEDIHIVKNVNEARRTDFFIVLLSGTNQICRKKASRL